MKISELPEHVRKKALDYQLKDGGCLGSDHLGASFAWIDTKEGFDYWNEWSEKKPLFTETITNPYIKNNYDSNGVTKPEQYQIGIDTFERAEANLSKDEILAICKFNIDKYCWRQKDQDKEDFQKIIKYAEWALKNL